MTRSLAVVGTIVALAIGCGSGDSSEGLVVLAASSLTEVTEELTTAHEARGGTSVDVVIGGSAALAAQIRDGAPADLFLSANLAQAEAVADLCSDSCSLRPFATNSLGLAVPAGNPGSVSGLADLARPDLRIVLCAPEVPCGVLAREVTTTAGIDAAVDSYESSVRAVRSRLELDEADAGLIYTTDFTGGVEAVPVEGLAELVTTYHLVVVDADDADAENLVDLMTGPVGREILADLGFGTVPE